MNEAPLYPHRPGSSFPHLEARGGVAVGPSLSLYLSMYLSLSHTQTLSLPLPLVSQRPVGGGASLSPPLFLSLSLSLPLSLALSLGGPSGRGRRAGAERGAPFLLHPRRCGVLLHRAFGVEGLGFGVWG